MLLYTKPYAHSLTSGSKLVCEISVYYMLTDHKSDTYNILHTTHAYEDDYDSRQRRQSHNSVEYLVE
jgi:hypothetical protein